MTGTEWHSVSNRITAASKAMGNEKTCTTDRTCDKKMRQAESYLIRLTSRHVDRSIDADATRDC